MPGQEHPLVSPQDDAARRRMGLPLFRLPIFTAESGFYRGFNTRVAIPGKLAIALLIGWQARLSAFLLAGFSLVSGFLFHYLPSLGMEGMEAQGQMISFMKNIAIAGGFLALGQIGAGAFSLDARRGAAKPAYA